MLKKITNCIMCGAIFHKLKRPVCVSCMKRDKEVVKRIEKHVKQVGNISISADEIAESLHLPPLYLKYLIQEYYFDTEQYTGMKYSCLRCENKITTGDYCDTCVTEIQSSLTLENDGKQNDTQHRQNLNALKYGHYQSRRNRFSR